MTYSTFDYERIKEQLGPAALSTIIDNHQPEPPEEDIPWWRGWAAGTGLEVGAGYATDLATTPLLAGGPLGLLAYGAANFGSGVLSNYYAQKLRGEEDISWSEAFSSGAVDIIPYIGQKLKGIKGVSNIALQSGAKTLLQRQGEVAIDEGRVLTTEEAVTSAGVGAAFGGTFKGATDALPGVIKSTNELRTRLGAQIRGIKEIATGRGIEAGVGIDVQLPGQLDTQLLKYPNFTGDKQAELAEYLNDSYYYRLGRLEDNIRGKKDNPNYVTKRELMKGFSWKNDNRGVILDDNGVEHIPVRKTSGGIVEWNLRTVESVENEILQNTTRNEGWDDVANATNVIKKELNRLGTDYPDTYYHRLMEYGQEPDPITGELTLNQGYLEHKVAQGMQWFWDLKASDPRFARWAARSRNLGDNIRLLFNQPYKKLKDQTEEHLKRKINPSIGNPRKQLVIDIDDPQSRLKGRDRVPIPKRNNPGHILIRRADTGQVVGKIGDYLNVIYDPRFREYWTSRRSVLRNKTDKWTANTVILPNETFDQWRARYLSERIDFIVQKIPELTENAPRTDGYGRPTTSERRMVRETVLNSALRDDVEYFYKTLFPDAPLRFVPSHVKAYLDQPNSLRSQQLLF